MKRFLAVPLLVIGGCITQDQTFTDCEFEVNVTPSTELGVLPAIGIGVQVAAKPIGMDVLNPSVAATVKDNAASQNGDATVSDTGDAETTVAPLEPQTEEKNVNEP